MKKEAPYKISHCPVCKSTRLVFDAKGRFIACLNCFENPKDEHEEINPLDDY